MQIFILCNYVSNAAFKMSPAKYLPSEIHLQTRPQIAVTWLAFYPLVFLINKIQKVLIKIFHKSKNVCFSNRVRHKIRQLYGFS